MVELTGAQLQGWLDLSITEHFKQFLTNLAIDNAETISLRYGEITAALNKNFRDTESKTANTLQVGSYGRYTAIKGISDLDMLYIVPSSIWDTYKSGGQYKLLARTKDAIKQRYPTTVVYVDGLVVRVLYKNFYVEVQPVFELKDGSFRYPYTKGEGSWKVTKPKLEITAMTEFVAHKNNNLRWLCKMARAWKNKHGVAMGGLLIDTLCHNFLNGTDKYDSSAYSKFPDLLTDFFQYLADQKEKDYYAALGSGQRVAVKKKFQAKSKKALKLCKSAIASSENKTNYKDWRKLFGKEFPKPADEVEKAFVSENGNQARDTEKHIEDMFPIDIRYHISIDCTVTDKNSGNRNLRRMLAKRFPLRINKSLKFEVTEQNVPDGFVLYWKVLNRGAKAIERDCIRGEISADAGQMQKSETADFEGDHMVECYAVLHDVVVARDAIRVPITREG